MNLPGTVSEILGHKRPEVWSVAPDATVLQAIQMMADKNVGALPVVEGGRLVGIISERDYTRKVALKGRSSRETPVRDIITRDLAVAAPDDTVVECMRVMTDRKVRHLPVLDQGDKLIGIVSIGDLVNWIISTQTAAIDQLQKYITGEYPA
jgi:CBS domain-containing protein